MNEKKRASEQDIKNGKAVFHIREGRSVPFDVGRRLPAKARFREETLCREGEEPVAKGTEVMVVQAELFDGDFVVIGYKIGEAEGLCSLPEIEFID